MLSLFFIDAPIDKQIFSYVRYASLSFQLRLKSLSSDHSSSHTPIVPPLPDLHLGALYHVHVALLIRIIHVSDIGNDDVVLTKKMDIHADDSSCLSRNRVQQMIVARLVTLIDDFSFPTFLRLASLRYVNLDLSHTMQIKLCP